MAFTTTDVTYNLRDSTLISRINFFNKNKHILSRISQCAAERNYIDGDCSNSLKLSSVRNVSSSLSLATTSSTVLYNTSTTIQSFISVAAVQYSVYMQNDQRPTLKRCTYLYI